MFLCLVKKLVQQMLKLGDRANVALTVLGVFSELDYAGGAPNDAKIFERCFLRLGDPICATQFSVFGLSAMANRFASSGKISHYRVAWTCVQNFGTQIIDLVCACVRITINDRSNINRQTRDVRNSVGDGHSHLYKK